MYQLRYSLDSCWVDCVRQPICACLVFLIHFACIHLIWIKYLQLIEGPWNVRLRPAIRVLAEQEEDFGYIRRSKSTLITPLFFYTPTRDHFRTHTYVETLRSRRCIPSYFIFIYVWWTHNLQDLILFYLSFTLKWASLISARRSGSKSIS